jgi:hypothetical protein
MRIYIAIDYDKLVKEATSLVWVCSCEIVSQLGYPMHEGEQSATGFLASRKMTVRRPNNGSSGSFKWKVTIATSPNFEATRHSA